MGETWGALLAVDLGLQILYSRSKHETEFENLSQGA